MRVIIAAISASAAVAFAPQPFAVRAPSAVRMSDSEYDLDYGKDNGYIPATYGDGGQGEFGAVSPNNWRVGGTSPIGETSYNGAADGGDEPWFSEAVSTVSLDLGKAQDTMMAFTKETADFKMSEFEASKPYDFTTKESAFNELVGADGYQKFLEMSVKQLTKTWDKLHPKPKPPPKEEDADGDAEKKPAAKKPAAKAAKKE